MNRNPMRWAAIVMLLFVGAGLLTGCILVTEPTPQPPIETLPSIETADADTSTVEDTATPVPDTPTVENTATSVPTQTFTSTPTKTPTKTPTNTPTPTPLPFALQTGSPAYIANFAHPTKGCNWAGTAGQIFGADGKPVTNLVVMVSGLYGGKAIEMIGVTGTVAGDIYGLGGYEIVLGTTALATSGTLQIQVFDLNAKPLSDAISFNTYKDCTKNLAIINFSE